MVNGSCPTQTRRWKIHDLEGFSGKTSADEVGPEFNFDRSKGPVSVKWFQGGQTNLSYNCLDRNVQQGHGSSRLIQLGEVSGEIPSTCSKFNAAHLRKHGEKVGYQVEDTSLVPNWWRCFGGWERVRSSGENKHWVANGVCEGLEILWMEEILHNRKDGWKSISDGIKHSSTGAGFRNHPQYERISRWQLGLRRTKEGNINQGIAFYHECNDLEDQHASFTYDAWRVGQVWNGVPWCVMARKVLAVMICHPTYRLYLVGGLVAMNFIFPYIGLLIIPIDELIFFRGVAQPPTRYSYIDYQRCFLG